MARKDHGREGSSAVEPQGPLLDEHETARYLGFSESWLRKRRMTGDLKGKNKGKKLSPGPKFIRSGRTIRYAKAALDEWIHEHRNQLGASA